MSQLSISWDACARQSMLNELHARRALGRAKPESTSRENYEPLLNLANALLSNRTEADVEWFVSDNEL